jgi:predicted small lipoprotein YifL
MLNCWSGLHSKPRVKSSLLAVVALAVALGGCGRKAGLDLPPSAAAAPAGGAATANAAPTAVDPSTSDSVQNNVFNSANGSDRTRYAPKLPPKRIAIDPILD